MDVIKKRYPIMDELGRPSSYPTFASQVFNKAGEPIENEDGVTAGNSAKLGGMTWAELMLQVYPVGSIYMSLEDIDPGLLFGGTWVKITGRLLFGAGGQAGMNTDGTDPGSDNVPLGTKKGMFRTTLTVSNLPPHTHPLHYREIYQGSGGYLGVCNSLNSAGTIYTDSRGGGESFSRMPPYIAVNMWQRIRDEEVA